MLIISVFFLNLIDTYTLVIYLYNKKLKVKYYMIQLILFHTIKWEILGSKHRKWRSSFCLVFSNGIMIIHL